MNSYVFLWTQKNSQFQLINSNIRNNTNLWISCADTRIDVINTSFSEITNTLQPLFHVDQYTVSDAMLNFINISFEYQFQN